MHSSIFIQAKRCSKTWNIVACLHFNANIRRKITISSFSHYLSICITYSFSIKFLFSLLFTFAAMHIFYLFLNELVPVFLSNGMSAFYCVWECECECVCFCFLWWDCSINERLYYLFHFLCKVKKCLRQCSKWNILTSLCPCVCMSGGISKGQQQHRRHLKRFQYMKFHSLLYNLDQMLGSSLRVCFYSFGLTFASRETQAQAQSTFNSTMSSI